MNKSVTDIFNTRLRRIMKFCKVKNVHIAVALGKSKNQISNYFTGDCVPPWNDTCKLIELLQRRIGKLDINFLYGNSEDSDLLNTVQRLQKELFVSKKAYDNLAMEYVLLKDKFKTQTNLTKQKNIKEGN